MTAEGAQVRWMGEQAVVTMPAEIDAVNADASARPFSPKPAAAQRC